VFTSEDYDWRELIYQMALDYYKYNFLDDFELRVAAANPDRQIGYPNGRTGYEQYYIDMQGFWRQLYNPYLEEEIESKQVAQSTLSDTIDNLTTTVYGIPNPNTGIPSGGLREYLSKMINSETVEAITSVIGEMYDKFPDYIFKDD